jgi:ribonuclease HII
MPATRPPTLRTEQAHLAEGHRLVAGVDEVGRGALGGPVSVGVVVVDAATCRQPRGLRDSKLLLPAERTALVPRIERWATAFAVGHASSVEIDTIGILAALRLAGERALAALPAPDVVILDGNYDWLTRPQRSLFHSVHSPVADDQRVELKIKGDMVCASVSAASVLAKVERDGLMCELAKSYPAYGWDENKGYATPGHLAVLRDIGPCDQHRLSWRLTGPQDLSELMDGEVMEAVEVLGEAEAEGCLGFDFDDSAADDESLVLVGPSVGAPVRRWSAGTGRVGGGPPQ